MHNIFPSGIKSLGGNWFLGGEDPDSNSFSDALSLLAGAAKQTPLQNVLKYSHLSHQWVCRKGLLHLQQSLFLRKCYVVVPGVD